MTSRAQSRAQDTCGRGGIRAQRLPMLGLSSVARGPWAVQPLQQQAARHVAAAVPGRAVLGWAWHQAHFLPAQNQPGSSPFSRRRPTPTRVGTISTDPVTDEGEHGAPGYDWPKLLALGVMFLMSCSNYTILQNLKDSIVVTAAGAEALPFLEAYGVLPVSLAFFTFYSWLTRTLPERFVYAAALAPLVLFYMVFAVVLYPLAPALHPQHLLETWRSMLPAGLVGLAGIGVNYIFSIFYVLAELWGGVAISLLFWGFANDLCSMTEAREVYPALGMLANVGLVASGAWIKVVNGTLAHGEPVLALRWLMGTLVACTGVLLGAKSWLDTNRRSSTADAAEAEARRQRRERALARKKGKGATTRDEGGLKASIQVLRRSPKVANLAVLVTAYFVTQKLFDFAWKAQLRVFYPSAIAYQQVLADVAQYTGLTTIALMACSKFVFKHVGWTVAAIITPLAMLLSGGAFYASAVLVQSPEAMAALHPKIAAGLVAVGATAGVIGRVVGKSSKYSLFDPAKEMVYITMEKKEKTEGKATVDLLGSTFGKSGASWITQALVLLFGSLTTAMPLVAGAHLLVCLLWTKATVSLGHMMRSATAQQQARPLVVVPPAGAGEGGSAPPPPPDAAPAAASSNGNGNGSHSNGGSGSEPVLQAAAVHANGNGNGHANGNGYANGNGNGNGYTNGNGHGHANGHSFTNGNGNGSHHHHQEAGAGAALASASAADASSVVPEVPRPHSSPLLVGSPAAAMRWQAPGGGPQPSEPLNN